MLNIIYTVALYYRGCEMSYGPKELGRLTGQLAEALDDLAVAVENYRMQNTVDPKVDQSHKVAAAAIEKAMRDARKH